MGTQGAQHPKTAVSGIPARAVEILHRAFPEYAGQIILPTDCSPSAEASSEGPKCGVAGCTFSKLSEDELGLRCHLVCESLRVTHRLFS